MHSIVNTQLYSADGRETDDQIVAIYLSAFERSRYTYRNYKRSLDLFRRFIGDKRLSHVTWRDIEAFKLALNRGALGGSGKPKSNATIAMFVSALRSFYKWGSDANIGIFRINPTSCIRSPKVSVTSRNHYLTKDELAKLLSQLRSRSFRDYLIGLTLVILGLRVSELVQIRKSDFHKDPTGASTWLAVRKGKGDKMREVKVPEALWQQLRAYMEEYASEADAPLFPLTERQVERVIRRAREDAQLEKPVTPHWLRHTSATMALLYGASLQQVQDSLGHVQINTTQRYLHTVDFMKKAAPDFVEDGLLDIMQG
ncbi:tyrosine-type recombinase/integrase [Paenibacillus sp.]|uniref:tyrosine-type recombinase/integrase n=1 Tax=Paenibacillus sp. TaxID=58172 RepID=UPI002D555523|nr:tyrosine-type recombinase/integrase [Paenibacillus sp.]HZG88012.1 tyrosine-type recombinase/integrase [Paenibacillus sp.]